MRGCTRVCGPRVVQVYKRVWTGYMRIHSHRRAAELHNQWGMKGRRCSTCQPQEPTGPITEAQPLCKAIQIWVLGVADAANRTRHRVPDILPARLVANRPLGSLCTQVPDAITIAAKERKAKKRRTTANTGMSFNATGAGSCASVQCRHILQRWTHTLCCRQDDTSCMTHTYKE